MKRSPFTRREKLSQEQREQIFALYLKDRTAAADLASSFGVARGYAAKLACERGVVLGKKQRKLTDAEKSRMRNKRPHTDYDDPRWKLAIERGGVSI